MPLAPFKSFKISFSSVRIIVVMMLCLGVVTACGGNKRPAYRRAAVETLYNNAADFLERGQYAIAVRAFDEVERQHPYSVWARRAQLMSAFAHYMSNSYDETILSAERFLSLHPGNEGAAYAAYIIAVSYYEQISDVGRDQNITQQALNALTEVVRRYPNTEYARDARLKMDLTLDHLAGKNMEVGRFYMKQGHYLAAIGRFRSVIENYQSSSHTPEALHRLAESYVAIGIESEAQAVAAVLGYNFPGTRWYQESYALLKDVDLEPMYAEKSWVNRVWTSLF